MINFKSKGFLVTFAVFLIAPVILNFTIFQFSSRWTNGSGDQWFSFWGNYIGGTLSGLVAFIIAKITITEDRKRYSYELRVSQLPVMIRIKMEMEKIISQIEKAYTEKADILRIWGNERNFNVEEYPIPVNSIDEEKWSNIDKLQDIDLQVKLIEIKEFYSTFSQSLNYDGIFEKERFGEIIESIGIHLPDHNPDETSIEDAEKYRHMLNELQYHDYTRLKGWEKLEKGYKQTIQDTYKELLSAIETVKREKERFEKRR